jgi:hypothetical protein
MGVELLDGLDLERIERPGARGLELVQEVANLDFDGLDASEVEFGASGATRHEGCVAGPVRWIRPFVQGFVQSPDDQ